MKFIIEVRDGVTDHNAIYKVARVVENGQVSEAGGIKQYCFATTFDDGTVVAVKRRRSKNAAHSFVVMRND